MTPPLMKNTVLNQSKNDPLNSPAKVPSTFEVSLEQDPPPSSSPVQIPFL